MSFSAAATTFIIYALRHPYRVGIAWCVFALCAYALALTFAVSASSTVMDLETRVAQEGARLATLHARSAPLSGASSQHKRVVVVWPPQVALRSE